MAFSLSRFVEKYDGKRVSGYSSSGGQCVDLVRQYMKERWGNPYLIPRVVGAKEMFAKASSRTWRKFPYKRGLIPPIGAIVVQNPGVYGHVSIALSQSNADSYRSFDQNWRYPRRCSRERHRYTAHGVIGWLVKR